MDDHWQPRLRTVPVVVAPFPVDPDGVTGPTKGQATGPRWRRVAPGAYVPTGTDDGVVEQRIVDAAARITGSGAVTGWAALRLHRAAFFDGLGRDGVTRLPVPLAAGADRFRGDATVVLRRDRLADEEVVTRCGVRCTTPHRALLDEVRRQGDLREAVVSIDMATTAEVTSIRRFGSYLDGLGHRTRGLPLALEALAIASEGARSPQRVRLRMTWVLDAGWDAPLVNQPVYDDAGSSSPYRTCSIPAAASAPSPTARTIAAGPGTVATWPVTTTCGASASRRRRSWAPTSTTPHSWWPGSRRPRSARRGALVDGSSSRSTRSSPGRTT